ncbi:DUF2894 domain-containing protein [Coralloluteibacterium thermophilus]|uniref:DUF2894 domain-containing protein n=1 Tax=Coralloluteibacterium thermophilum TaxID=2707049 RepID=A0ABV9NKW0_9GAMM
MTPSGTDIACLLRTWRAARAGRPGTVRAHRIEALAARAERVEGAARDVLDAKLAALVEADMPPPEAAVATQDEAPPRARRSRPEPLAQENAPGHAPDSLGAVVAALSARDDGDGTVAGQKDALPHPATPPAPAAFPALPALDQFRRTWTRIRTEAQLQRTLADVPEDAGPMHSTVLVHRALGLMRDTAPGYLQHFLTYVDALSGLEQMFGTRAFVEPKGAGDAAPVKPARGKTRRRPR